MFFASRTIYNVKLQTDMMFGAPYYVSPNTTLNEKFSVFPFDNSTESYPTIKYLSIGLPATLLVNEEVVNIDNLKHKTEDGVLYATVPFVVRTVDDDLTPIQRNKYRLRVVRNINSIDYVCYYLKMLEDYDEAGRLLTVDIVNNEQQIGVYEGNNPTALDPVPGEFTYEEIRTDRSYLLYVKKTKLSLTLDEIDDICKSIDLLYGEDTPKILGELALVSGREVDVGDNKEVIDAQIAYFADSSKNLNELIASDKPLTEVIDVGGMEPVLRN